MQRFLVVLVCLQTAAILLLLVLLAAGVASPLSAGVPSSRTEKPPPQTKPAAREHPAPSRPEEVGEPGPTTAKTSPLAGALLFGRVMDREGDPLMVRLTLTSRGAGGSVEKKTFSTKSGTYAIAALPPGPYSMKTSKRGLADRVFHFTLADASPRRFDLTLGRKATLPVHFLTPEGGSLLVALRKKTTYLFMPGVVLTEEPPRGDFPATAVKALARSGLGRWQPASLNPTGKGPDGNLILEKPLPLHASMTLGGTILETRRIEQGLDRLEFIIAVDRVLARTGSIRLRLEDGRGNRPDQAHVSCKGSWFRSHGEPQPDGSTLLSFLQPGVCTLSISAQKLGRLTRRVRVAPGEAVNLGTILLRAPVRIRGKVLDPEGRPTAARIRTCRLDQHGPGLPLFTGGVLQCGDKGEFQLGGLQPGRWLVRAVALADRGSGRKRPIPSRVGWQVVEAPADVDNLVIRLQQGAPVMILDPPAPFCLFSFLDGDGRVVATAKERDTVHLLPGAYTLLIHRGRELLGQRRIRLGDTGTTLDLDREKKRKE